MFDWRTAVKIPVYIFGPVEVANLSGSVIINGDVKRGMIHFGSCDENVIATREPIRLYISGQLSFNGHCKLARAVQLLVWDGAALEIGNESWFGSFTKVVAFEKISIGDNFMCSWECQIFDTDFHFLLNHATNQILNNVKPISIGMNVWLGSRVTVLKGTKLPDDSIVAASSVCNNDYSNLSSHSITLGGIPAKLLNENFSYITDKALEKQLFSFFRDRGNKDAAYNLNKP